MTASGIKMVYATSLTEVFDTKREELGTIRREGKYRYKYIQYKAGTGTVAGVANSLVGYWTDAGYDADQVTMDYTDVTVPAGMLLAAMTDLQYGWIQIGGPIIHAAALEASNDGTPVAAADGDPLVIGDADGAVRRENTVVDADVEAHIIIGVTPDASLKKIILMLPD